MMEAKTFNVTISSNNSKHLYPTNTTANFRVRLPQRLLLSEQWRVGLADVTFNNPRLTFDRPEVVRVVSMDNQIETEVLIPPALYETSEMLVEEINKQIGVAIMIEHRPVVLLKDGKVKVQSGFFVGVDQSRIEIKLEFSPTLDQILGISRWGIPSLNARQPIIFLYTNIVKARVVGDVAVRLLRTVDPSKGRSFGSIVSTSFRRIYFCPLDAHAIDEIEIQLLYDTGLEPVFKFGDIRLTLQFRKF